MTRTDRLALISGAIAGLVLRALWRHRQTALAFREVYLDSTSPQSVAHSISELREMVEAEQLRSHLDSCIWISPARQSGAPCLGGTRIPVASLAAAMEGGDPQAWYPNATPGHIATVDWWLTQPGVKDMLRRSS